MCQSGRGLEASLAHHVVRLCWAAMSDCRFHQRQMIIRRAEPEEQISHSPSCLLITLRFIMSQMVVSSQESLTVHQRHIRVYCDRTVILPWR